MEKNQNEKKDYGHRMFLFGIEVIFYFGVPAVLGVLAGKWIENSTGNNSFNIPILFATYFISWIIVIARWKSIKKSYDKKDKI